MLAASVSASRLTGSAAHLASCNNESDAIYAIVSGRGESEYPRKIWLSANTSRIIAALLTT